MIAGIFHEGSGLGDQLFRYITVRTLAEDKGFKWGMFNPQNFKGEFFRTDEITEPPRNVIDDGGGLKHIDMPAKEEKNVHDKNGNDIRSFDPEIALVEDNFVIDGSFEDSKYWGHNLDNISKWLAVEPLNIPNSTLITGFRGGEYASIPELFLPKKYYTMALVKMMYLAEPLFKFEIHTDDPTLAREFLNTGEPIQTIIDNQPISHSKHTNMALNWRTARYAKYAIIPNSAFFILPRLLKHFEDPTAVTIAPRYWAGHNQKIWKRPACYYPQFTYIHASDND